ncbi:MAG: hypothetical protein QNJ11_09330 [Woeseiaceae bacterium]|nr:hypothetical protein [Woeseiaceae bacterium]
MIRFNKNVRMISALFLASVGSAALAQGLPGSGDGSIGGGFNFDNHYVGSNACVSSCFGAYGNTADPLWSVETRDPFGNMTNTFGGIVIWDEDGDGNEENVDMSRFEITVEKLDHVESPDGTIVVVLTVNAVEVATGESQTIKTVSVTVNVSDIQPQ